MQSKRRQFKRQMMGVQKRTPRSTKISPASMNNDAVYRTGKFNGNYSKNK